MITKATLISFLLFCYVVVAQEVSLPADLRQHALTQYNASLFNPTYSLDRNNPQSVSFWTRWQWQQIDADPTTLFLNYSRRLNEKSGFGVGFFQHNTGIYFNTGGVLNYAYEVKFNPLVKVSIGANLFGFQQQLADTRFLPDPDVLPVPLDVSDDFILQLAPGVNLSIGNFSLGMASENLFDYNVTDKGANTDSADKIFMGMVSYDFPLLASDETAFLRPSIYLRTIPEQDNQIGANALFSTKRYWVQAGYNNFYGISGGIGGSFFNRFSVGALVEFGTSSSLNSKDASFELIASFFLGNPEERRDAVVNAFDTLPEDVALTEEEKAEQMQEELEKAQQIAEEDAETEDRKAAKKRAAEEKALAKERRRDSLDQLKQEKQALALQEKEAKRQAKEADEAAKQAEAAEELKRAEALAEAERAQTQRTKDSLDQVRKMEEVALNKRRADSIRDAQAQNELIAAEKLRQRQQDSIRKVQEALEAERKAEETRVAEAEKVTPQAGEKYEEVITEEGLEPGFYLIANVFGTKKYFEAFMQDLRNKGIEPGSFLRSRNNYNYAYLKRYNTISEARRARDSNFDGKYEGKTWIFRVVGE